MDVSIIFNIVPRLLPTFMLGLVSMLGMILLRKSIGEIISGTIKTMAGVLVLFTAVDVLDSVISPIAALFGFIYVSEGGAVATDWTAFLGVYGVQIVLVMVIGFLINLLLARIIKWKYIFLTGHIMFWNAFMVVAALVDNSGLKGILLVVVGGVVQGLLSTLLPAMVAPFVFKLTGRKDFTIGHTTTVLAVIGALVGKWLGDPSKSTEDMELPEGLSFMKSMTVSTTLVMILIYLVHGMDRGCSCRG